MVDPVLLIAGAVAVLVAVGLWWSWKRDKETTAAFRTLSKDRGWSFTDKDRSVDERYDGFAPFDQGHDRYGRWLLTGQADGISFELFTYHYEITRHTGKTSHTDHHWHRVCSIEMPLEAPDLLIKDEHVGHKLWDAVGGEDIDLESDAFSRRYWVQCEDRKFAYDVLHTGMMDWLLERSGWVWQWDGDRLVVYDEDGKMHPEDCDRFLELALGFRERLPRHLVADL